MNEELEEEDKKIEPLGKFMGLTYWERVGAGAIGGAIVAISITNYQKIASILGSAPSIVAIVIAIFIGVLIIFYGRYGEIPV